MLLFAIYYSPLESYSLILLRFIFIYIFTGSHCKICTSLQILLLRFPMAILINTIKEMVALSGYMMLWHNGSMLGRFFRLF